MNEHSPMPRCPISLVAAAAARRTEDRRVRLLQRLGQHAPLRAHVPVLAVGLVLVVRSTRRRCDRAPRATSHGSRRAPRRNPRARRASTSDRCRSRRARRTRGRAPRPTRRCGSGGCTASAAGARRSRCGCSFGARRDRAVEHLGVRAVRVLLEEVVLDGPERVEAHLVAEHRLLDRVLVGLVLLVGRPRARRRGSRRTARTSSCRTPLGGVVDQGARPYSAVARPASACRVTTSTPGAAGGTVGRQGCARHRCGVGPRRSHRTALRRRRRERRRSGSRPAPRWDEVAAAAPAVSFHIADVTDEEAVESAIAAVLAAHGRLDVVVNYAGVAGGGPVHMLTLAEWSGVHRREPRRHVPRVQARARRR